MRIAKDILSGINESNESHNVCSIEQQAVRKTIISCYNLNDVVLVAGKGHEENILIGDTIDALYSERAFVDALFNQDVFANQEASRMISSNIIRTSACNGR